MIIGFGSDLVDVRRIEKIIARFGTRFIKRCFTAAEQEIAEKRRDTGKHIDTYAKRFAAKEACAKALGTGIYDGVFLKDIGVENEASGAPKLVLSGGALKRLEAVTPQGRGVVLHLSLSDELPLVQAQVIIEAR